MVGTSNQSVPVAWPLSYGHSLVIAGYKWDCALYKWNYTWWFIALGK